VAGVRERVRWHEVAIRATHAEAGQLENRLRQLGRVTGVEYGTEVCFTVAVRALEDLDRLDYEPLGTVWVG
jgi:hypothetical protein